MGRSYFKLPTTRNGKFTCWLRMENTRKKKREKQQTWRILNSEQIYSWITFLLPGSMQRLTSPIQLLCIIVITSLNNNNIAMLCTMWMCHGVLICGDPSSDCSQPIIPDDILLKLKIIIPHPIENRGERFQKRFLFHSIYSIERSHAVHRWFSAVCIVGNQLAPSSVFSLSIWERLILFQLCIINYVAGRSIKFLQLDRFIFFFLHHWQTVQMHTPHLMTVAMPLILPFANQTNIPAMAGTFPISMRAPAVCVQLCNWHHNKIKSNTRNRMPI